MGIQDRGQLFVLAALALAVMIIGVALLLNSSLYSANLAAQNADPGVEEPREFLREAEIGANRVMEYSNYNNESDYETLKNNFTIGVKNWSTSAHRHKARSGTGVEVRGLSVTNGSRITQDSKGRQFLNNSGFENWTIGTGLSGVRTYRMNVSYASLDNVSAGPPDYETSDYFRVKVTSGGSIHRIYIYRNELSQPTSRIFLRVEDPSGDLSPPCSTRVNANGRATLYLSDGLIGSDHCEQLAFFDSGNTQFSLNYTRGSNINGSYELFADRKTNQFSSDNFGSDATSDPPVLEPAIYNATLKLFYTSSGSRIRGNRTATPDRRRYLDGEGSTSITATGADIAFFRVPSGELATLNNTGAPIDYTAAGSPNTGSIGPVNYSLDGDPESDIPYVENGLNIVDINDDEPIPGTSGGNERPRDDSTMAVAEDWYTTTGPYIYYAWNDGSGNPTDRRDEIRRADSSGYSIVATETGAQNGIQAVAGVADIDGDPGREIVYVDETGDIRYLDDDGSTFNDFSGLDIPSVSPPGIGIPADFNGDGVARVPYVNSTAGIVLADPSGSIQGIANGVAESSAMASVDWDRDGTPEIVFIESAGTDRLRVIDDVTSGSPTISTITYNGGNEVVADPDVGVRGGASSLLSWVEAFNHPDGTDSDTGSTAWSTNPSSSGDVFSVQSGQFESTDADGKAVWESELIDISGASRVQVSADVDESGDMENDDALEVAYVLDGEETQLAEFTGDFSAQTLAADGLTGSNVRLIVRSDNSANSESHFWDDVSVIGSTASSTAPTSPWDETFTGVPQGAQIDTGSTAWTTTRPTSSGFDENFLNADTFSVQGNQFQSTDTDAVATWKSETVDISGAGSTNIDVTVDESGDHEPSDTLEIAYVLDGTETQIANLDGNFGSQTVSASGLTGNNVRVIIRSDQNANNENHFIESVSIN